MRPRDMHRLAHGGCHDCGPKAWHDVPNLSGDYDLDATIMHRPNKDLPDRLALHTKRGKGTAYGPKTAYRGYHNYSGDD